MVASVTDLIDSHSWSMVKIDRNGLRFFFEQVLSRDMPWLNLVEPPVVKALPDVLTPTEIGRLILVSRKLSYQSFWWVTFCYTESKTGQSRLRALPIADFL